MICTGTILTVVPAPGLALLPAVAPVADGAEEAAEAV